MHRPVIRLFVVLCLLVLFQLWSVLRVGSTHAADLRAQFEGKTVTIIHGSSPGGGYDLFARAMARFLPDYLPGKPARIIVQPRPGGGPFRVNSLRPLVRAKPDGLTIGNAYAAWVVAEAIGGGHPKYNLEQLKPLGTPIGLASDTTYCTRRKFASSWKDIEKLGRPVKWGGIAPGIGGHLIAVPWLKELGAPVKLIWGYGGTSETSAAFRRGETELMSSCMSTLWRDYPDWVNKANIAPIFYVGHRRKDQNERYKQLGFTRPPHLFEVAKEYITGKWQTEAVLAGHQLGRVSRAYFVPAGLSKELYGVWSEVFRKVVNDPRFVNSLHPNYRDQLSPMYAQEMEEVLKGAKNLSPKGRKLLKILAQGR